MQANFQDRITIPAGKAGDIEVDTTRFDANVMEYVFNYGLKQILSDCHSSEPNPELAHALSTKKLDALYEGKVRASGNRESDPVKKEAKRLAVIAIDGALKAQKIAKDKLADGKYAALVKEYAARESVMAKAKANVEEQNQLAPVDLGDLAL